MTEPVCVVDRGALERLGKENDDEVDSAGLPTLKSVSDCDGGSAVVEELVIKRDVRTLNAAPKRQPAKEPVAKKASRFNIRPKKSKELKMSTACSLSGSCGRICMKCYSVDCRC